MNRGNVYTVASVNQYIKNMFSNEYALTVIFVRGEISNCKYHSSGHIYFTLKDASSQLACVMFAGDRRGLDFRLENGQEVVVGGSINVYERDGKYQLYAKKVKLAGDGALAERYEKLKKELLEAGYFDEDRKLPIPKYVRRVGIVTASTGAAVQDMIQIAGRRNPYVQLILYPAKVQGEGAAESIAAGIRRLDREDVDVIVAGRGGGSMEDLWAFNEKVVADAIYNCRTPVISAVGHQTDHTISDEVADLRAPTPSAAMELAVYDVRELLEQIYVYEDRMARSILAQTEEFRDRIQYMADRLKYLNPENRLLQDRQQLLDLEEKLELHMNRILQDCRHSFALLANRLDAVSPLKRLAAGYAYVSDESGVLVDSVNKAGIGDRLLIRMTDGTIISEVKEIEKDEENK